MLFVGRGNTVRANSLRGCTSMPFIAFPQRDFHVRRSFSNLPRRTDTADRRICDDGARERSRRLLYGPQQ